MAPNASCDTSHAGARPAAGESRSPSASAHERSNSGMDRADLTAASASATDVSPYPRMSYAAGADGTMAPACHEASSKTSKSVSSSRSRTRSASAARSRLTAASHARSSDVAVYMGAGPFGSNRPARVWGLARMYPAGGANPDMDDSS